MAPSSDSSASTGGSGSFALDPATLVTLIAGGALTVILITRLVVQQLVRTVITETETEAADAELEVLMAEMASAGVEWEATLALLSIDPEAGLEAAAPFAGEIVTIVEEMIEVGSPFMDASTYVLAA